MSENLNAAQGGKGTGARVPAEYLPIFCGELHQMVHSGISPAVGLPMLKEDEKDPAVLSWLSELCESTERGMPLADALKESGAFPDYMTDMVDLAEKTGHLEDVLLGLRQHYDRQNRLQADIRNAVTVPSILLFVMIAVILLLITQVLPIFDRVFAQLGVRMGTVATGLMQAGSALAKAGTVLAVIVAVVVAFALIAVFVQPVREKVTAWFNKNYGGRGILGDLAMTRFASAMAMASGSGMGIDESLAVAGKLCGGSREIDEKLAKCRELTDRGESAVDALSESGLFAGRESLLLKLSERTGALSDTLEELAARKEEESLREIDHAVSTIEPAIVVVSSVICAVILLSVMLPLMGLLSTVG